jgi:2-amino-4-hydroxy-6-hydroxymethyldihydropteridine diphosphokinase
MERVFVGLGSNVGDREASLRAAAAGLGRLPQTRLVGVSPVYETPPVGPIGQGPYLNAAAHLETQLLALELLEHLRDIEAAAGRGPQQRIHWGPRVLDLDILLFGQQVISTDRLTVPHPLMHDRWFVLRPLADLAPGVVHPLLQMTSAALLENLDGEADDRRCGRGRRYECAPLAGG